MRSIQTGLAFPLSSVKPLDGLKAYRDFCLAETRNALAADALERRNCLACEAPLRLEGQIGGLDYRRCPDCASLFLALAASPDRWENLLSLVNRRKHSPDAFHAAITASRNENVYLPKIEWMQHALRLNGMSNPRLLELRTPPSPFTQLLRKTNSFSEVVAGDEMGYRQWNAQSGSVDAAVLLECLDRIPDPAALLSALTARLTKGGLVFVTALVSSGFDMALLGLGSHYLYPPDRMNCFSLDGLVKLLTNAGFSPVEISTPGVLDVEIVEAHRRHDPSILLSNFERRLLSPGDDRKEAFQTFLQENLMSSFARLVCRAI